MADIKKIKSDVFGTIAAAQTILERYPVLSTLDSLPSISTSVNAGGFLLDLCKTMGCYDKLLDWLADFITSFLPVIEYGVKGLLLTNIKQTLSCSLDPRIPKEFRVAPNGLATGGMYFDISQIDFNNILSVCPLVKPINSTFYFGCDELTNLEQLRPAYVNGNFTQAADFNAFLWYVIHQSRYGESLPWFKVSEKGTKPVGLYDFVEHASNGSLNSNLSNIVHFTIPAAPQIYLGGTGEKAIQKVLCDENGNYNPKGMYTPKGERTQANLQSIINGSNAGNVQLCYPGLTIYEFNYDYVMSMQLFDAKVVAAQVIDSITGALSFSIGLTQSQILAKERVAEIVKKIINSGEEEINDCFFTFSNDEYDTLLHKAELKHAGLYEFKGETNTATQIDPEMLLKSLNEINSGSTLEEQKTIIKKTFQDVQVNITDGVIADSRYGLSANFILQAIEELTNVLVQSIISPKIYMLIEINNMMMGKGGQTLSLEEYLQAFLTFIIGIVKEIRDLVWQELLNFILDQLKPLAELLTNKLVMEQVKEYKELLTQLLKACALNWKSNNLTSQIDNVNYADIIDVETSPKTSIC